MIETLYPLLGSMMKKAMLNQVRVINEKIERTANQVFTLGFWKSKFKSLITGIDHSEVYFQELYQSKIEDVFVIQKGSGLLIAKYKLEDTIADRDTIAGALEAIKGFAESVIGKNSIELEKIDYGEYNILLHNYHKFYFAVLCSGVVGNHFIQDVNEKIVNYASEYLQEIPTQVNSLNFKDNSENLQKYF